MVEVSTDKVDLEVPAPAAGTLAEVAVEAGQSFAVGQPLGRIAIGAGAAPRRGRRRARADAGRGARPPAQRAGRPGGRPGVAAHQPGRAPPGGDAGHRPGGDPGHGPGGMVRKADVLAASPGAPATGNGGAPTAPAPAAAGEEAVALRGPAAALAGYMDESLSIPTPRASARSASGRSTPSAGR